MRLVECPPSYSLIANPILMFPHGQLKKISDETKTQHRMDKRNRRVGTKKNKIRMQFEM